MNLLSKWRLWIGLLLILSIGCHEQHTERPGIWSQPQETAKSSDSLSTSFSLHKWNQSLLALGGDNGTYAVRLPAEDGKSWKTYSTTDPRWTQVDVDPNANRIVVSRATLSNEKLDASFSVGSLSPGGEFMPKSSGTISLNKTQLFLNARSNLEMSRTGRILRFGFAGGTLCDSEIRIPYSITATPIEGKIVMAGQSINANGVFASPDEGRTWQAEPIVTQYLDAAVVCKTIRFYYFLAKAGLGGVEPRELVVSSRIVGSSSWSRPEAINKSVAHQLSESLHAIGEGDTAHLCWLDARNEKTHLSLTRPRAENYEVAYCRRKDSDAGWSKDVILSKGLRWAYAPSMSVEGNNVVVAWAGAKSDKEGRNEWNASDIYYVVSKDGGNTWTKPIKITDGFKSGITAGRPQVALHKGVIHLFYIQGGLNYQKVSTGMVKLNQPPWPILYQQRPFPK